MYVPSSATVTVRATLTNAGRRLLAGINSPVSYGSPNIIKFSLGDSDINYSAITATGGVCMLPTGFVLGPGKNNPEIKYMVLQSGIIDTSRGGGVINPPPSGDPILLTVPNGPSITHTVNVGVSSQLNINLSTEWPAGTVYPESYTYIREQSDVYSDMWDIWFDEQCNNSIFTLVRNGSNFYNPTHQAHRWYHFRGNQSGAETSITIMINLVQ